MLDLSLLPLLMQQGLGRPVGQPPMGTPPFNPNGGQPQLPQVPVTGQKPGFYDRLLGGLFGAPEGMDPAQAKAAQNRAMLQLGLGMMAGGAQGRGLGEGAFNAYAMASKDFEGAMDKAFQSAERKRLEEKRDRERAEDMDWRKMEFSTNVADRRAREQRAAEEAAANREFREKQLAVQKMLGMRRDSDDAARGRKADIEAELMARRVARLDALERKRATGQLSPEEQQELIALTTGARLGYEPRDPFAFMQGMGGIGGMGAPAGNPLLNDPRL